MVLLLRLVMAFSQSLQHYLDEEYRKLKEAKYALKAGHGLF
jgi:hypothetical protein